MSVTLAAGPLPCGCTKHFDSRQSARAAANVFRGRTRSKRLRWDVEGCPIVPGTFVVIAIGRATKHRRNGFRGYGLAR